ncbi:hypothetical protein BRD17_06010 [Halobacteriales archaeon SW_7_68_16]|nr:MAG: hypothetical protein BRD17_06010 [Halobacteriales archaeon SW_7_68_16]
MVAPDDVSAVSDTLAVAVSGTDRVETAVDRFNATGAFEIEIHNDGTPTHVHLALDGALAETATVGDQNPYVDTDETVRVPVTVAGSRGIDGAITVSTGRGADSDRVEVHVLSTEEQSVPVDESLSQPVERGTDTSFLDALGQSPLPVVALAVAALGLGIGAASVATTSLPIAIGFTAVLFGVVVAAALLAQG